MGLRLFFLPNFPGATFIQGATYIPDSRATSKSSNNVKYSKWNFLIQNVTNLLETNFPKS